MIGGTNNYTWSAITPMVPGLTLDSTSGVVSGTPTNTGNSNVTIQVTDDAGNTTTAFVVNFSIAGPTATPISFGAGPSLGPVQQGFVVTFNLSPRGGTPPYTITALTPLPSGFALESDASILSNGNPTSSYFLAGNPLASGSFSFDSPNTWILNVAMRMVLFPRGGGDCIAPPPNPGIENPFQPLPC